MPRPLMVLSTFVLLALTVSASTGGEDIKLPLRTQIQPFHANGPWVEAQFEAAIVPSKTAIIITDMWDKHWCKGATHRVGLIAQRMEPLLALARGAGILIIHAPSETMDFYSNAPGRMLAENAPRATLPPELAFSDAPLPIDDSDGGCDTPGDKFYKAWSRETEALTIAPGDVISDTGRGDLQPASTASHRHRAVHGGAREHVYSQPELWRTAAVEVGTSLRVGARSHRCHV